MDHTEQPLFINHTRFVSLIIVKNNDPKFSGSITELAYFGLKLFDLNGHRSH
jgi:hypothetical protein